MSHTGKFLMLTTFGLYVVKKKELGAKHTLIESLSAARTHRGCGPGQRASHATYVGCEVFRRSKVSKCF